MPSFRAFVTNQVVADRIGYFRSIRTLQEPTFTHGGTDSESVTRARAMSEEYCRTGSTGAREMPTDLSRVRQRSAYFTSSSPFIPTM